MILSKAIRKMKKMENFIKVKDVLNGMVYRNANNEYITYVKDVN